MRRFLSVVLLAVALFATATSYVPDTLTVTFLDVGEADAAIVQAPNGHTMLVDAGRQGNSVTVSNALAAEGITRLDYVVGTHEDADHIGGMVPVLSYMELGEYVNNGVEDPDPSDTTLFLRTYLASRGITPRAVEAGDSLALDPANVTVTVLNPPADPGSDDNEASVVLRLVYGTQSFLLAGDAEQAAEGWMIASGRPLASRILKVGHHGGATATSAGFVAAVDPDVAVISVGPNAYGHPSQAVVKRLQDSGATVYSTGASGTVRVTATRTGYTIATADGPELPGTLPGASHPSTDSGLRRRLRRPERQRPARLRGRRLVVQPSNPFSGTTARPHLSSRGAPIADRAAAPLGPAAILMPAEVAAIRSVIGRPRVRILFDMMLYTGMRYAELRQVLAELDRFDDERGTITLLTRGMKQRTVVLGDGGREAGMSEPAQQQRTTSARGRAPSGSSGRREQLR